MGIVRLCMGKENRLEGSAFYEARGAIRNIRNAVRHPAREKSHVSENDLQPAKRISNCHSPTMVKTSETSNRRVTRKAPK